ncbi:MAG: hypothetical protein AAF417_03915 [Pseudomonadota bacterium]
MIRLTVSYNLPHDSDEEEFIAWRLSEHQRNNESMPGVVRTDFARIVDTWSNGETPEYAFQTTVDWPDRESFERGFYDAAVQEKLQENLKRLASYTFTVSEVY